MYNHVNNRGEQYWIDVVNCLMRKATYVLDGLLYQVEGHEPAVGTAFIASAGAIRPTWVQAVRRIILRRQRKKVTGTH